MQILKDEATREQYDYALAHPEEVFFMHSLTLRCVFVTLFRFEYRF